MPAALGRAIQNVYLEKEDKDPDAEDFATTYGPAQAAQDADRRGALWRSQLPAIMVTTTLVLGVRRLRAQLRRRVDAWKALAITSYRMPSPLINPTAKKTNHRRCNQCQGYIQSGVIPNSALCKACSRPATNVCTVCRTGIHLLGECALGSGSNSVY